jgi:hypothetical protein
VGIHAVGRPQLEVVDLAGLDVRDAHGDERALTQRDERASGGDFVLA